MATLVPENLRSRRDLHQQIRDVAAAFHAGLDEDAIAWFEPPYDVAGEKPHFVVLDPRIGVIVVEVLALDRNTNVLGPVRDSLAVESEGIERRLPNPLDRARRLRDVLSLAVSDRPPIAHVPIGQAAAVPSLDRAGAEKALGKLYQQGTWLCSDELQAARGGRGATLEKALRSSTGGGLSETLESEQIATLRGVIHPEVVIPTQPSLFEVDEHSIAVMDLQQELLAKNLGAGHRVIRGVAGSGKTLVAICRAKLLARRNPSRRVLFTCFNKTLASVVESQLQEYPNIDVRNIDKVTFAILRKSGRAPQGDDWDSEREAHTALPLVGTAPYAAVVVDEAQDFGPNMLRLVTALTRGTGPEDQDLLVIGDGAQSVYQKRPFTWKEVGIAATGRTRVLDLNYRNTKEILTVAGRLLPNTAVAGLDSDELSNIVPAESAVRSGPAPALYVERTADAEIDRVIALACELGDASRRRGLGLLYAYAPPAGLRRIIQSLPGDLSTFWVTDPQKRANKNRIGWAPEPVVLSTILSAKGLEFPRVVLFGLDFRKFDDDQLRRLAYVGMTRGMDQLHVVTNERSRLVHDLRSAFA